MQGNIVGSAGISLQCTFRAHAGVRGQLAVLPHCKRFHEVYKLSFQGVGTDTEFRDYF